METMAIGTRRTTAVQTRASLVVVCSMLSVQCGAAIAERLFDRVGAPGVVLLRQSMAAAVLWVMARPKLSSLSRSDWRVVGSFGAVFAAMNLTFYESVDRLPLGIAVTIELLGPIGLAAALARSKRDLGWCALALGGVVLLGGGGRHLDTLGVVFAVVAAAGWATYILLSRSTGQRFEGTDGLTLALAVASIISLPLGLRSGAKLAHPDVLLRGFAVAMLSAAIPFTLELRSLRKLPAQTFGVLMSLSPAIAALLGLVLLDQRLGLLQVAGIACVTVASAGATLGRTTPAA